MKKVKLPKACPTCGGTVRPQGMGGRCTNCNQTFGRPDLGLKLPEKTREPVGAAKAPKAPKK